MRNNSQPDYSIRLHILILVRPGFILIVRCGAGSLCGANVSGGLKWLEKTCCPLRRAVEGYPKGLKRICPRRGRGGALRLL